MADSRSLALRLTLAAATVFACMVAVVLFRWPNAADSDSGPAQVRTPRVGPSHANETASVQAPAPDGPLAARPVGVPSLEALRRLCPDPWTDGVPSDCETALDDRYGGEGMRTVHLYFQGTLWEPPSDPLPVEITWDEAFADPVGTHKAVEKALRHPECAEFVVRESAERFGLADVWESSVPVKLRGVCAADEAAKLAMLHEGCVKLLSLAGRFGVEPEPTAAAEAAGIALRERDTAFRHDSHWGLLVEDLNGDPTVTPGEYWQRRDEIEDGRFRFAWRRLRCYAVDVEAFSMLDALPGAGHDVHQGNHLRRYAARLGNEWAIAVARRFEETVWDRDRSPGRGAVP